MTAYATRIDQGAIEMSANALPANVTVREEWAVHSDGIYRGIYRVTDDSRANAEREAALLQRGVDGEPGEPGAVPAHRYVMETPEGTAATGWRRYPNWTPPAEADSHQPA